MKKMVSIIVPVYNRENTVKKCILSLVNQSYENIEIIIIDDGSIDNTKKICTNLAKNDSRIKYFYQQNRGVSSARNNGIKKITGDYFMFVDSDDYIKEDCIQVMLNTLEQTNVDMVLCKFVRLNLAGDLLYIYDNIIPGIYNSNEALKKLFVNKFPITCCGKIYRTSLFNDVLFDTSISNNEDKLYIFDCLKRINSCIVIDYFGYYYLDNDNSLSKKLNENVINSMLNVANAINNYVISNYVEYKNIPIVLPELEICRLIIINKTLKHNRKQFNNILRDYRSRSFNLKLINNKKRKIELILLKHSVLLYIVFLKLYLFYKGVVK